MDEKKQQQQQDELRQDERTQEDLDRMAAAAFMQMMADVPEVKVYKVKSWQAPQLERLQVSVDTQNTAGSGADALTQGKVR